MLPGHREGQTKELGGAQRAGLPPGAPPQGPALSHSRRRFPAATSPPSSAGSVGPGPPSRKAVPTSALPPGSLSAHSHRAAHSRAMPTTLRLNKNRLSDSLARSAATPLVEGRARAGSRLGDALVPTARGPAPRVAGERLRVRAQGA